MSNEWVASCRNIADLLTRNKWKRYAGKCSLRLKNSAPVRAEFKDSAIENTDEFITILRDVLKNPESFK